MACAGNRGGPRGPGAPRTGGPAKPVTIDAPAIPFDELKKITNNFSDRALIGEGSYGRVYNATLSDGRAAVIKKLDTSASQDSDTDFAAQVHRSSILIPSSSPSLIKRVAFVAYTYIYRSRWSPSSRTSTSSSSWDTAWRMATAC